MLPFRVHHIVAKWIIGMIFLSAGLEWNGSRPEDPTCHDDTCYWDMVTKGNLGLGESYMAGKWSTDRLDLLISKLLVARKSHRMHLFLKWLTRLVQRYIPCFWRKQRQVVETHYQLDPSMYADMLGAKRVYSCAYFDFEPQSQSLEDAQQDKLRLICEKLHLSKDDHLLDIGCGYGELAKFAAQEYGCRVTGLNLCENQLAYARMLCNDLPHVQFVKIDYREFLKQNAILFNKIVSVGFLEHVGEINLGEYFSLIRQNLMPGGLSLVHTISCPTHSSDTDAWIDKYVFPGGWIPDVASIVSAMHCNDMYLLDTHEFGWCYAETLRRWMHNLNNSSKFTKKDAPVRRMWEYYLMSCAAAFDVQYLTLQQFVFGHGPVQYQPVR